MFACLYRIIALFGLDTRDIIASAPRILQAVFAAIADWHIYKLACRLFGERAGKWALFSSITNWFMFYCMVRTFSNSAEASIASVAYYYWPWQHSEAVTFSRRLAVALASLTFILRPSSGVIWGCLGVQYCWSLFRSSESFTNFLSLAVKFASEVLLIGSILVLASVGIDKVFYGAWTFVPYNFVKFNALTGGSHLYGINHWSYYFTEAYPAMLLGSLPLSLLGVRWSHGIQKAPVYVVAIMTLTYSMTAHKEYRFVLPAMPIILIYVGHALDCLQHHFSKEAEAGSDTASTSKNLTPHRYTLRPTTQRNVTRSNQPSKGKNTSTATKYPKKFKLLIGLLLISNCCICGYLSVVHQRAPIAVMEYLSTRHESIQSIGFLTGCHSAPLYSLFHIPGLQIPVIMFDCSPHPDLMAKSSKPSSTVVDTTNGGMTLQHTESSDFNSDPLRFVREFFDVKTQRSRERGPTSRCPELQTAASCLMTNGCVWYTCSDDPGSTAPWNGQCTLAGLFDEHFVSEICPSDTESATMQWVYQDEQLSNQLVTRSLYASMHPRASGRTWIQAKKSNPEQKDDELWGINWQRRDKIKLPSHLVLYDRVVPEILPFLMEINYERLTRLPHAHISDEGRFLEVWTRSTTDTHSRNKEP